jgi:hypothetical protein
MVTLPGLPLTVFFRPDRGSERTEIVFELGRVWSGPPQHLGSYSVEIERNGAVAARLEVPKHYWFSRWRWQSAMRPVVAKPAELIAAGLLPPYQTGQADGGAEHEPEPAGAHGGTPAGVADKIHYEIMGLAGLTAYMPTTGDRREIGPVTEAQGRWICTGAHDALHDMMAQAEASGTIPWNVRDEKTGAPFNFEKYPKAGWIPQNPKMCDPYIAQLKSDVTPDWAHHPSLSYVPFLATGDPYYLESLQLSLTWLIGLNAPEYRLNEKCILSYWQTRNYAWCLRDAAQAAKVTPEAVPGWLLPREYWRRILKNNRIWFAEKFVNNPEPPFRVFRAATIIRRGANDPGPVGQLKVPRVDPFEEDYLAFVLGWTTLMFPAWRDAFVYKIGATIARTDGKSGWVRAYATPYLFCLSPPPPAPWAKSWKEAWDINLALQRWEVADPDRWSEKGQKGLLGYLLYTRAALALAAHLGLPQAKACYEWVDHQLQTASPHQFAYRWNVSI